MLVAMVTVMLEPSDFCPMELTTSQEHHTLTRKSQCSESEGLGGGKAGVPGDMQGPRKG